MTIDELRQVADTERRCGQVFLNFESYDCDMHEPLAAYLDAFVQKHGFRPLGDQWTEIDCNLAKHLTIWLLQKDLAYYSTVMPERQAQEYATLFFGLFDRDARFFTNYLDINDADSLFERSVGWRAMPLTSATYDCGVIAVDHKQIGILCVADED